MDKLRSLIVDNFRWRGRLSRKGLVLSFGLFYLAGFLNLPLHIAQVFRLGRITPDISVPGVLLVVVTAATAWFMLGAFVRRLHDRGKGVLWLLLFFGPFAVLAALSDLIPQREPLTALMIVATLFLAGPFMIWGAIEILTVRGQPGDNRFGPDPLAPVEAGPDGAQLPEEDGARAL